VVVGVGSLEGARTGDLDEESGVLSEDDPKEWSDDSVCRMEVNTSGERGNNSGEGVHTSRKRSEREERENEGRN
jgi:hypothetical protein